MSTAVRKACSVILAAALICTASAFGAAALKIDGVSGASEWKNADTFVLEEQDDFGNNVKSAVVKLLNNEKSGYAGLLFMIEFQKDGNMEDGQIRLQLNDGKSAIISIGTGVTETGGLNIDAESDYDSLSGCSITEVMIERRNGIHPDDVISVFITDLSGNESNEFIIQTENEEPEEDPVSDETEKSVKSSKTTKAKSSKSAKTTQKKAKTTKKNGFTFKKVDKNRTEKELSQTDSVSYDEDGNTVLILDSETEEKSDKKYIFIAAACVCALGVTVAAAAGAIKSNEEKDKKDK